MKLLAPFLLFLGTVAVCLGLLESALDLRDATDFVRPYHYGGMFTTALVSVAIFWPFYRRVGGKPGRGAIGAALAFVALLLLAWAVALPLGDRIAVHAQMQAASEPLSPEEVAWFYPGDSGMGHDPMQLWHLLWGVFFRPWWALLFLAFFPSFFGFHRKLVVLADGMKQLPSA